MKKIKLLGVLLLPVVFSMILLLTLKDYGISWDEPLHFARGQAYFYYLTTGKTNYSSLSGKRSYFQNNSLNAEYFLQNDSAHPPANDIIAAFFNYVFYQRLGWLGDIESLHLFNVVASTLLVLAVCFFAYETLGFTPALISGLIMATYPLFFAESHFNIKDPAETAFFTLSIYFFWKSLQKFQWKWLIAFGLSVGLALGIKFNIVFLPLILTPYVIIRYLKNRPKIPKRYYFVLALSPFIALAVFYLLWPYLWGDPVFNLIEAVKYYKRIGLGIINYQSKYFLPGGLNLYPLYWIGVTTPPLVLVLATIGFFLALFRKGTKEYTPILWFLWFIIPVLRVSVPGTAIYGGIRQIMEFFPALALLAGLGASFLISKIKYRKFFLFDLSFCIFIFYFLISPLWRLHPNENVYFNFLVGGLKGAKARNIPYWGNSFGNAYLQAIRWLNANTEPHSRLALIQGTSTNIPVIQLREDIQFSNSFWSGIDRRGEYLVELTHDDPVKVYPYVWGYVEKFLKPVYEVKVDEVAIAKVWKNDLDHSQDKRTEKVLANKEIRLSQMSQSKNAIEINFNKPEELSRVTIAYARNSECYDPKGYVEIKNIQGVWIKKEEPIPSLQMEKAYRPDQFTYFLLGDKTDSIKFTFDNNSSCALIKPSIRIMVLQ